MAYNDPQWVPEHVLAAMNLEASVHDDMTQVQLSRKIFEESAPLAAARIAHLATHSPNETVALRAAMYITDRVLGKPGEETEATDPLQRFLDDMTRHAEEHANKRV